MQIWSAAAWDPGEEKVAEVAWWQFNPGLLRP